MVKKTDLLVLGAVGVGAYWLLTKGKTALAAGGGTVAEDIISGAGEVSAGVLRGAAEGAQEFIFNIQDAGAELGQKNANDLLRLMDETGIIDAFIKRQETKETTIWEVGQTEEGLKQVIPVPKTGYTTKGSIRTGSGEIVTVLDGKRIDEMTEQEFFSWKQKAGFEKTEPIPGGVFLPGVGQTTGETLGTSMSLIREAPKVEESVITPVVTTPTPRISLLTSRPRSLDSGKSQVDLKTSADPEITKERLTSTKTETEPSKSIQPVPQPTPLPSPYPTVGVGLPVPTPTAKPTEFDVIGGITSFFRSVASFFGF